MSIKRVDKWWWHKLNGGLRFGLVHSHGVFRMPLINEFPKSGGTWLTEMISDASGLPFPRDRLPVLRSSLLHGHYRAKSGMKNVILLWRDGRDIMVSWYYHRMFESPHTSAAHTAHIRKETGISEPNDIQANLPTFIEYCMTTPDHPRFTWPEFVTDWADRQDVLHLKYEDLLAGPETPLINALEFIGADVPPRDRLQKVIAAHSFAAKTKRTPGQEDKTGFLRKGIAGDWKNQFSPEAVDVFNRYAGDALVRLGYEKPEGAEERHRDGQ